MIFYTFWQGPDQLKNAVRDFLLNNITSHKVHFKGSNALTVYNGWADSFEETLSVTKHTGSLWTTGDILFSILENSPLLKYNEEEKIKSALKTFLEIRHGILAPSPTGSTRTQGRAQTLPKIQPGHLIEQKTATLFNRIDKDGFPEKVTLIKEKSSETYELDTNGSNNIFACSSLLIAMASGLKHGLEPESDIKLKDRVLSLAKEIVDGFCEDEDEIETMNKAKSSSTLPAEFPLQWAIQPGRKDAAIDLYAVASALMALSYTYIRLKYNTDAQKLSTIENSILKNIDSFCKLIEENFGPGHESVMNKKFSDITRAINSLVFISDFINITDNKDREIKKGLINEKLIILSKGLTYKLHHVLIHNNGKPFDQGRISRELSGEVVQFSGVDVSSIFVALLLAIPKMPPVDLKEIGYDDDIRYLTLEHPIIGTLFHILEDQVISPIDAEKINLTNKANVIGGYVWAGNDTSNPDCYQDIYFWQAAYAYWGVSLYIKLCEQIKSEARDLYKINLHRKLKNLEYRLNNQIRLLLIFTFNLLAFFVFLSSDKYWGKLRVYPLIIILCYFLMSALFSLYYFYTDNFRSYLKDISAKHKWIDKLVFKTPFSLRPNLFVLLIIPVIIDVKIIKPIIDIFKTHKKP